MFVSLWASLNVLTMCISILVEMDNRQLYKKKVCVEKVTHHFQTVLSTW